MVSITSVEKYDASEFPVEKFYSRNSTFKAVAYCFFSKQYSILLKKQADLYTGNR